MKYNEKEREIITKYDAVIIGAGFAGATIAQQFAHDGKKVLILDKRNHIGGNMYDYIDDNGVLIHQYGPHLFHTNDKNVYEYLQQFGTWFPYEHKVLGKVKDKLVPIPFNLTSIEKCFPKEKSDKLKAILTEQFGLEKKVPILELKNHSDHDINELASFIYENVFLHYTMKQWGQTPEQIDPAVTNRVPVFVSRDDRYFQDKYQYMPENGYTSIFKTMLQNENITVQLETEAKNIISIMEEKILLDGKIFTGSVIYTGALDELFDYRYGNLPYRTLNFEFETIDKKFYQPVGTVNYPTKEEPFTRVTEYKHMTMEKCDRSKTTIMREYPKQYENNGDIPYYPINNSETDDLYQKYVDEANKIDNLYLLGRLAQYKYFNMDLIIKEALKLYKQINEK